MLAVVLLLLLSLQSNQCSNKNIKNNKMEIVSNKVPSLNLKLINDTPTNKQIPHTFSHGYRKNTKKHKTNLHELQTVRGESSILRTNPTPHFKFGHHKYAFSTIIFCVKKKTSYLISHISCTFYN